MKLVENQKVGAELLGLIDAPSYLVATFEMVHASLTSQSGVLALPLYILEDAETVDTLELLHAFLCEREEAIVQWSH